MEAYILIAIFFPLLASPLFFFFQRKFPYQLGWISMGFSLLSLMAIILAGMNSGWNKPEVMSISWIPSLGVNLSFITDGLSLFFGILVTAMGCLVNLYAQYYMDPNDPHLGRFYCCLTFFMAVMLGTVLADNLMIMFMFWELTGVASFLLIGYKHPNPLASYSARMSILVTSLTSLALMAGIFMLKIAADTFEWSTLAQQNFTFSSHPDWIYAIILCFLIGIFGKSAQFPLYFWLPNAMVAPTPVSAYLHSATMVKLGVFLTARMFPLFVGHDLWYPFMTSICFTTLLIGAILSLLSYDLKAILAYATVSQLGFFLGFYGIGGEEGIEYDFIHILNHAFYKGSLFMLVGIVEHATGIRDIRHLGGLWQRLPLTATIMLIATAAMAGFPGTTGFLSKELILTDLVAFGRVHHSGWIVLSTLIAAMLFKVGFSIRLVYYLIIRKFKPVHISSHHQPGWMIHVSPLILSLTALLFGFWPKGLEYLSEYFYVSGLHKLDSRTLQLWHGWTIELLISLGILVGGAFLFFIVEKTHEKWLKVFHFFKFAHVYDLIIEGLPNLGKILVDKIDPKTVQGYLLIFFLLSNIGVGGYLALYSSFSLFDHSFASISFLRLLTVLFIVFCGIGVVLFKEKISKLLALSGVGFFLAFYFVIYEAPDLAMTQILVEVVTLLLILLFVKMIPAVQMREGISKDKIWKIVQFLIALGSGCAAALITLLYQTHALQESMKDFYLLNSVPFAKGSNVVNTILVDFRGLDTLGEATVLLTAMLAVMGILSKKNFFKRTESPLQIPMNSLILHAIMPLVFLLVNIFAFYLLLRGHDYPGGGFIGGLATGISLLLMGLVNHQSKGSSILGIDANKFAFGGLGIMLAASLIPLLTGHLFLTHDIWLKGWLINTPLIFDIGVYLVVVAITVKIYFVFRKSAPTGEHHGI